MAKICAVRGATLGQTDGTTPKRGETISGRATGMAEFRAQKSREMEPLPTALKAWIAEGWSVPLELVDFVLDTELQGFRS